MTHKSQVFSQQMLNTLSKKDVRLLTFCAFCVPEPCLHHFKHGCALGMLCCQTLHVLAAALLGAARLHLQTLCPLRRPGRRPHPPGFAGWQAQSVSLHALLQAEVGFGRPASLGIGHCGRAADHPGHHTQAAQLTARQWTLSMQQGEAIIDRSKHFDLARTCQDSGLPCLYSMGHPCSEAVQKP